MTSDLMPVSSKGRLMRGMICLTAALWAGAAGALPEAGCYTRVYGERHMARNPDQVVAAMRLRIDDFDSAHEAVVLRLDVVLPDQGRASEAGLAGQVLGQTMSCLPTQWCYVECDNSLLEVVRQDGAVLEVRTDALWVGRAEKDQFTGLEGKCGGVFNLAEAQGTPTTYRLYRTTGEACEGLKD